jgi:hypothetical protein
VTTFAAAITKTIPWRGKEQEFSNVYHYRTGTGEAFNDIAVINNLTTLEKGIYPTNVKFLHGRTWGPTEGLLSQNVMREVVQLTGTGSQTPVSPFYPELAIMVYWPLGRYGSRNRPQFLRKWLHLMSTQNLPMDGSRYTGTFGSALNSYVSGVKVINPLGTEGPYELTTPKGEHLPTGDGVVYPYLEHRQLGR